MRYTLGHVLVLAIFIAVPLVLVSNGLNVAAVCFLLGYVVYDLTGEISEDIKTWRDVRRIDGLFR